MYVKKEIKRKTIFSIIIALIIFGFVVGNRASADCPPNWYSASFIADIDGCLYLIMYCYKCGVTGPDPGNLKITFYGRLPKDQQPNPGNCPDEPDLEALKDAILEKTEQHWMQQCEFPPCDTPRNMLNIVVEYPLCVRSINTAWTDHNGIRRHFVVTQSCGNYYCQYISVCCRDYSIPPPNVNCIPCVQVQPQGDPMSCSQQPPQIPPPGFTWDDSWETECYVGYSCKCPE